MLGIVAADVLYDDILNLTHLGQVGLVFTFLVHLACSTS